MGNHTIEIIGEVKPFIDSICKNDGVHAHEKHHYEFIENPFREDTDSEILSKEFADEHELGWCNHHHIVTWSASGTIRKKVTLDSTVGRILSVKWITLSHYSKSRSNRFLCILTELSLTLYNCAGAVYRVVLPCPIVQIHPLTPHGMLLERLHNTPANIDQPSLLSLLHPLEELRPVLLHSDNDTSFFYDSEQSVLMSINNNNSNSNTNNNLELPQLITYHKSKQFLCFYQVQTRERAPRHQRLIPDSILKVNQSSTNSNNSNNSNSNDSMLFESPIKKTFSPNLSFSSTSPISSTKSAAKTKSSLSKFMEEIESGIPDSSFIVEEEFTIDSDFIIQQIKTLEAVKLTEYIFKASDNQLYIFNENSQSVYILKENTSIINESQLLSVQSYLIRLCNNSNNNNNSNNIINMYRQEVVDKETIISLRNPIFNRFTIIDQKGNEKRVKLLTSSTLQTIKSYKEFEKEKINPTVLYDKSTLESAKWRMKLIDVFKDLQISCFKSFCESLVLKISNIGITIEDLNILLFGISIPIREAIRYCRQNPPFHWTDKQFNLIGRNDLSWHTINNNSSNNNNNNSNILPFKSLFFKDKLTTFDSNIITQLNFDNDLRLEEVRYMLSFSSRIQLTHLQEQGVSDHDYLEQLQSKLWLAAQRTMALPIGYGMLNIGSVRPVATEPISITPLVLGGVVLSSKTNISLNETIANTPDLLNWPEFHAGAAAGFSMTSDHAAEVTNNTWIVYNRPSEFTPSYSGLLMALGLQGKLSSLAFVRVFEYLSLKHQITSVGLLIGIAASKRGTMEMSVAKILSIHIPSLHPPSSIDLDVPSYVQIASVMGIGLLYQGSGNRRMTEVLLNEIGRKPINDKHLDRDSYTLTAGMALGLINLGRGGKDGVLEDLNVENRLKSFIGNGSSSSTADSDCFGSSSGNSGDLKSNLIYEGTKPNINITEPGAIFALTMIYLKSNNQKVASYFTFPESNYSFNFIRSDFLLLRSLGKSLIMWNSILPTEEWIQSEIPINIKSTISFIGGEKVFSVTPSSHEDQIDLLLLAYLNIVAGLCLSMGLRYAGSLDQNVANVLMVWTQRFLKYQLYLTKQRRVDRSIKSTIEVCISVSSLSVSLVLAGTGDVKSLKLFRTVRSRLSKDINYGNHMAIGMAIGFLFLGGGQLTLSTNNLAIASLLISLYPKFPQTSTDNHYHLQVLRHLYYLAVEPRCLITRDIDTKVPCKVPVEIETKNGLILSKMSPCLLPESGLIKSIRINTQRYWNLKFNGPDVNNSLPDVFSSCPTIYVKRKIGYLPYSEDPEGFKSLQRSFPKSGHRNKEDLLKSFSADRHILAFAKYFCTADQSDEEDASLNTHILYQCLTHDKPEILATLQLLRKISLGVNDTNHCISDYERETIEKQVRLLILHYNNLDSLSVDSNFRLIDSLDLMLIANKLKIPLNCL